MVNLHESLAIADKEAIRFGEMLFATKGQNAEIYYNKKFVDAVHEIWALQEALGLERNSNLISELLERAWSSAIAKKLVIR
jgi:hypothetical protein